MKWLLRIGAGLIVVVVLLALIPFFIGFGDWKPTVEKELSARLNEPVSIDGLNGSFLPVPHVTATGITIGRSKDIKVAQVVVKPALWSLLRDNKVIRSVDFNDVTLTDEALGALLALAQRDKAGGSVQVENVKLRNATVQLPESRTFGPFDADVEVGGEGGQGEVALRMRDGSLRADIKPQGDKFDVELTAKDWTPAMGPAIRFDALSAKGTATRTGVEFDTVTAKLYGGTVDGKVALGWSDGATVKGTLEVKGVELKDAAALVSPNTRVSGKLDAKPAFNAKAANMAQLDEALHLETPFTVANGVLYGFDLHRAAVSLGKQTGGGETRFEQLAGHLVLDRKTYRLTQLQIASSGLSARGGVSISPARALSGNVNLTVAGLPAAVPLTIAGTLESPSIAPNAGALIGAAAGTAILGPGLGTAAGAKLEDLAKGLLGSGKKR